MLIVGLNGSPQRAGNTYLLLDKVLKRCAELGARTEIIHVMDALEEQEEPYCVACATPCPETCHTFAPLADAYDLLRDADALVVGSPVYFGTISGQLKSFWDKSRNLRGEKALVNKPAGALAVGAGRFGGQETTIRAIQDILLVHGMRVIGDGSMASGPGHQGVCAQRPAETDNSAIERAKVMGEALFEAASK
ncbi:MAG TPA: flavodoxin family protein [Candidatus Anoxymicrobiaceae bacterium]|jgi:multimeric flavodoxin WrbA